MKTFAISSSVVSAARGEGRSNHEKQPLSRMSVRSPVPAGCDTRELQVRPLKVGLWAATKRASRSNSPIETPPRDRDVPAGGVAGGCDFALAQRVPHSHHSDESVREQCLRPHLRTGRLPDDASFEIDGPVAKRGTIVWLPHEAQPHAGSLPPDASNEVRSEVLHKAFAGPSVNVRTSCVRLKIS